MVVGARTDCVGWGEGRPYRPPELLFGAQGYDAGAVDRWALGAVLAEFFTALRLEDDEDDEDEEDSDLESESGEDAGGVGMRPFVVMARAGPDARWTREALFDAERGDIGLAWSIFQIRGTPDGRSWPVRWTRWCDWRLAWF